MTVAAWIAPLREDVMRASAHYPNDALVQAAVREALRKLDWLADGTIVHKGRPPKDWRVLLAYTTRYALRNHTRLRSFIAG